MNPRTLTLLLVRREGLEFNILVNYNVTYVPAGSGTEHLFLNNLILIIVINSHVVVVVFLAYCP